MRPDVLHVRNKEIDQVSNDRNIKGETELDINTEKNESSSKQTKRPRKCAITRSDDLYGISNKKWRKERSLYYLSSKYKKFV